MKLAVLYFSDGHLIIKRFTGAMATDNYIEFDDTICGWFGISCSTLGTITEDMVFCEDTKADIRNAKLVLLDDIDNKITDLTQELESLCEMKDELNGTL